MLVGLLTFGLLLGLMAIMSVGWVFNNKELQGSCGGAGSTCACDEAGRPRACEVEGGELGTPKEAIDQVVGLPSGQNIGHTRNAKSGQALS